MPRPKQVKTIYGPVTVRELPDIPDALGLYQESKSIINVLEGLSPEVERKIFLHELAHFWIFWSGLRHGIEENQEERLCDYFATFVLDLIRKNPQLVSYLVSESG